MSGTIWYKVDISIQPEFTFGGELNPMNNTIKLLVKRHWKEIPTENISYITISDKLSYLHLKNQEVLSLFLTLSEYEKMLPQENFIRIRRNCIVNYAFINCIDKQQIHLITGEYLPYSMRREKKLFDGYNTYIQNKRYSYPPALSSEENLNLLKKFEIMDDFPLPFSINEVLFNKDNQPVDYIFRYTNKAMNHLLEHPKTLLIGKTFGRIFPDSHSKCLSFYTEAACHGKEQDFHCVSTPMGKTLHVRCYQVQQGLCGCIYRDVTAETEDSSALAAKLLAQDKYRYFLQSIIQLSDSQMEALERLIHELTSTV